MSRRSATVATVATVAALVATSSVAAIASPGADDPERAAERESQFWTEVIEPGAADRREQVADAVRALRLTNPDLGPVTTGLHQLVEAAPDDADGWGYLAIVAERRRQWAVCGRAYQRLVALDPTWRPHALLESITRGKPLLTRDPLVSQAACWSRAGEFASARVAIEAAIDRGESGAEVWLVAGQVALAQGRLDDAITALNRTRSGVGAWLLAIAYDRAGRDAEVDAIAANELDDTRPPWVASDATPFAIAADADYGAGVAALHRGRFDRAVVYFRRYLATAGADARWRRRADEHARAAAAAPIAASVALGGSDGDLELRAAVTRTVGEATAPLASCMASIPTGLAELTITLIGPPARLIELKPSPFAPRSKRRPPPASPAPPPPRPPRPSPFDGGLSPPRFAPTQAGVSANFTIAPGPGTDDDVRQQALTCLERAGAALRLPAPAPGAWLTVRVAVRAR